MTNLKIARFNGTKSYKDKTYYDYTLIDERGYTFSILSTVKAKDTMEYMPVIICSYKGQPKIRVDVETVNTYKEIE